MKSCPGCIRWTSNICWNRVGCLLAVLLSMSQANAQETLRVMVTYDADGHRIEAIYQNKEWPLPPLLQQSRARVEDRLSTDDTRAVVNWYAATGKLLRSQYIRDPRLRHVPAGPMVPSRDGGSASAAAELARRVVMPRGTYLLVGPAAATTALVVLPKIIHSHQLPGGRWTLVIDQP